MNYKQFFQQLLQIQHISFYNQFKTNLSYKISMSERKVWKQEEDQILKEIYEQKGIKKWRDVSRMMISVYGMEGRNGKQCRQRYHNHLKVGIKKEKWSREEGTLLVKMHNDHGNRWAFISKLIPGRSQNCVKNMLYSKLRKSLRQINRFSYCYFRKIFKQIKINFIYKLMEFTEHAYKKEESDRHQQERKGIKIKNAILDVDFDQNQELCEQDKIKVKNLIADIYILKRNNQWFKGFRCPKISKTKINKKTQHQEKKQSIIEIRKRQLIDEQEMRNEEQENASCSLMQEKKHANDTVLEKQLNKISTLGCCDAMKGLSQCTIAESSSINKEIYTVSTFSMNDLENNRPFLLADKGLEYPIPVENQFFNLTPSKQHASQIYDDWANSFFSWKHNQ